MKISTPIIIIVFIVVVAYFWLTSRTEPQNDPSKSGLKGSGNGVLNNQLYGSGAAASADFLATNYPNLSGADAIKVKAMAEALNTQLYKPFPNWNDLKAQAQLLGSAAPAVKPYYNNRYGISVNTLLTAWRLKNPLQITKINQLNNLLG